MPPPPPAYGQTQQFPYNTGQSPQNYGGYTSPSPSYGQSAAYVGASSTDYQNYSLSAMATATANVSETQNAYGGTQSNHQQNTNVTGGGEYSNSYTLQYQQQPIVAVQQQQKDPSAAIKRELTSKLQMELEKMYKRIRDDIDLQFEHQLALTDTNEKVEQGIVSLNKLREDLLEAIDKITAQDEELAQWLIQNEQKTTVDPDTIILTADVSSKQLIDALAEQQAIEDTLYFMDRALSNGEMDVAMFLKEVRKLSRKQFMCQAIMQKISEVQCQTYAPSFSSTTM
jgi:ESCRT-I complex subunit TSG101